MPKNNNVFDTANESIRNTESSLVNLLSAIAPWGAPLAPAYMSFNAMQNHLGFTWIVAIVISAVIEILGLATVHTTILFWQHNRRYKMEYKKQPTALAAGMFGLYLFIILGVNVILEAFEQGLITWAWTPIAARAMLSLLAVPAAVTMAIRTQHTELLNEIQSNRKGGNIPATSSGKKEEKPERKVTGKLPESSDWRSLPSEDKAIIHTLTTAEIVTRYNVSDRTARNWKSKDGKAG